MLLFPRLARSCFLGTCILISDLSYANPDNLVISFVNTGVGVCQVVTCPGNNAPTIVIDCGRALAFYATRSPSFYKEGELNYRQNIAEIREQIGSREIILIVSHEDDDHYSMIDTLIAGKIVDSLYFGGKETAYGPRNTNFLSADYNTKNNITQTGVLPETLDCGIAKIDFLSGHKLTGKYSEANAHSLIVQVKYNNFKAIFPGDAYKITEEDAMPRLEDGPIDLLVSSHHGANRNGESHLEWVTRLSPKIVVHPSGHGSSSLHGHPRTEIVNRFHELESLMNALPVSHPTTNFPEHTIHDCTKSPRLIKTKQFRTVSGSYPCKLRKSYSKAQYVSSHYNILNFIIDSEGTAKIAFDSLPKVVSQELEEERPRPRPRQRTKRKAAIKAIEKWTRIDSRYVRRHRKQRRAKRSASQ